MKRKTYAIKIDNFKEFLDSVQETYEGVLGGEYENGLLELWYEDNAKILTDKNVDNVKPKKQLKFRKIVKTLHKEPNITIEQTKPDELVVKTTDVREARKRMKENYPDYEEVIE